MNSSQKPPPFRASGTTRRQWLQVGGLSLLAGTLRRDANGATELQTPWGDRRCVFIMLQGGPSHLDLWDPKPLASEEIRGPFSTIATSVPGIAMGELVPQMAARMDRIAIVRSMTHLFTNHIAGTYVTMTGSDNQPDRDREAHSDDFPGPGAILNYLSNNDLTSTGRSRLSAKVPRSISLPNWLSIPGPSNRMPGQYAGMLGSAFDPFLLSGDPNRADYDPLSLKFGAGKQLTEPRLVGRLQLLREVDALRDTLERETQQQYDRLQQSAYDLVSDGRVQRAIDLDQESPAIRDRYGRNQLGQSLLIARRLIETGVQFVSFNEFNQKWDTHGALPGRYRQIVPPLDQAYAALIDDLHARGLLDNTLVILGGEFGRTPRINNQAGRDHWPNAYSMVLAGGGVRGGAVFGETDHHGAEVISGRVHPADILATMWQHLGIAPQTTLTDRLARPHLLSSGRVLHDLLTA